MADKAREDYWRITGLPNQITDLPVDGHVGPESVRTHGEGYTFTVRLTPRSNSETQLWPDHDERYLRFVNTYAPNAGKYTLHQLTSGEVAFTETHDGESLLVSVTPPTDTSTGRGGYYLVSAVTDNTTLPSKVCLVEVELTYLAPLSDYEDIERAQAFLEADTI